MQLPRKRWHQNDEDGRTTRQTICIGEGRAALPIIAVGKVAIGMTDEAECGSADQGNIYRVSGYPCSPIAARTPLRM
jgi:hypothetical protein